MLPSRRVSTAAALAHSDVAAPTVTYRISLIVVLERTAAERHFLSLFSGGGLGLYGRAGTFYRSGYYVKTSSTAAVHYVFRLPLTFRSVRAEGMLF